MSKEFEYNYFFELYKKQSTLCHQKFKRAFKKKHPKIKIDLDKMIIEIERYQINKYGNIIFSSRYIEKVDNEKEKRKSTQRYSRRFKYGKNE